MAPRTRRQRQQEALWAWVKWVPVIAIPFSALFVDVWLHAGVLEHDFELGRLDQRRETVEKELERLRVREAALRKLTRLEDQAPLMGMIPPAPTQVATLRLAADGASTFELAARAQAPAAAPVPPERAALPETHEEDAAPALGLVELELVDADLSLELVE